MSEAPIAHIDPDTVPTRPHLHARLGADGDAELLVDGVSRHVAADTRDAAYRNILDEAAQVARTYMPPRPVRMELDDHDYVWPLIVTPDGHSLENTAAKRRKSTHEPAPAATDDPDDQPIEDSSHDDLDEPAVGDPHANGHDPHHQRHTISADAPPAPPEPTRPTSADYLASRPAPTGAPAQKGWRGTINRLSGGMLKLAPAPAEQQHRRDKTAVQRSFGEPRTIMVAHPKGGAGKTPTTYLLASTFGLHRGGYVLAWDNNETRGSLGIRAHPAAHNRTVVDLLHSIGAFTHTPAEVNALETYIRSQPDTHFDVLASDEDPEGNTIVDDRAFEELHRVLCRYYKVLVLDTGNNERAKNWEAAAQTADQLVIPMVAKDDHSHAALAMLDKLRKDGYEHLANNAVTLVARDPDQPEPFDRVQDHFQRATREVLEMPWDPNMKHGKVIEWTALSKQSREAWLHAAAVIADGM